MTYTLTLSETEIKILIEKYQNYQVSDTNNYTLFRAKIKQSTLTIYKTNKILIQGNNCYDLYKEISILLKIDFEENEKKETVSTISLGQNIIGTDEVGCGDYFGGILVCASFVPNDKILELTKLGIKDSKEISDAKILELGKYLINNINHCVLLLNNQKYNKIITDPNMNLNKIKAILHNKVINSFITKYPNVKYDEIIVDGFCEQNKYFEYLKNRNDVVKETKLIQKAENKYISVAVSSIIARYYFLKHLDDLSNKYGYVLLKGASNKVDLLINKIIKEKGIDYLINFSKINFKNTMKGKRINEEID